MFEDVGKKRLKVFLYLLVCFLGLLSSFGIYWIGISIQVKFLQFLGYFLGFLFFVVCIALYFGFSFLTVVRIFQTLKSWFLETIDFFKSAAKK